MELTVSREIGADPARVWSVITDLERWDRTLSGVERVERLDDGDGFEVGTRWRESRVMFGREATEEMEVFAIEPGRGYSVVAAGGHTTYTSTLRIEELATGRSRLEMTFGAEPAGRVAKLLGATVGRLALGSVRRSLQRDLDDIAAAAATSDDGTPHP